MSHCNFAEREAYRFLENHDDEYFLSGCGLHPETFVKIYRSYCGHNSPLNKPVKLHKLFRYYKLYPCQNHLSDLFGVKRCPGRVRSELSEYEQFLAENMPREINRAWEARKRPENKLQLYPSKRYSLFNIV